MILDFFGALLYIGIVFAVGQWTVKWLYKNEGDESADWLSFAAGFAGFASQWIKLLHDGIFSRAQKYNAP